MKVTTLAEKAMLVKLTTRRVNLTRRDSVAEAFVQTQLEDQSLVVNSKLFRDKLNPINQLMSKASEVYTFHKTHTLPYIDKGPRILPNDQYFDYSAQMRSRIAEVDRLMSQHMPNYDSYVQLDINYRSAAAITQGKPVRAAVSDYPSAEEFQARMGFDLRFTPLPEAKHFLFDLSDEDLDEFNATMQQVATQSRTEVVKKMLEPLQHLVEKLNKPIGTEGAIFRDSAVENIIEGVQLAKRLNVTGDDSINQMADLINQAVSAFADNKAVLRESPIVREQAAKKLDYIASQMAGMYGGAV
jgi:hypothetical protein